MKKIIVILLLLIVTLAGLETAQAFGDVEATEGVEYEIGFMMGGGNLYEGEEEYEEQEIRKSLIPAQFLEVSSIGHENQGVFITTIVNYGWQTQYDVRVLIKTNTGTRQILEISELEQDESVQIRIPMSKLEAQNIQFVLAISDTDFDVWHDFSIFQDKPHYEPTNIEDRIDRLDYRVNKLEQKAELFENLIYEVLDFLEYHFFDYTYYEEPVPQCGYPYEETTTEVITGEITETTKPMPVEENFFAAQINEFRNQLNNLE